MTDEVATQPTTPEAAQVRLSELSADRAWADKVLAQDPIAVGEFQNLTTLVAGKTTVETLATDLSAFNGAKMVDQFLAGPLPAGFPDLSTPAGAELAQILKGEKQISPELHSAVKAKLDSMIADAAWRARFDAKDQVALREFQLATTLLTADVTRAA
jgi:hypothetical protein